MGFMRTCTRMSWEQDGILKVFFKGLTQVSDCANAELSGALNLGELHKALQGMNSGKVSVIDGLPVEFYKKNWTEVGEDLLRVLNDSLGSGKLPLSSRRAVITLLPKKRRSVRS